MAKKILLFVVEGPSDDLAFGLIFKRTFSSRDVQFDVVHGDITAGGPASLERDPREALRDQVLAHVAHRFYGWSDIEKIILVSDTDGAFIPDESVRPNADGSLVYGIDEILAGNVDGIRRRNRRKAAAMRKLSAIGHLTWKKKAVPLEAYYLSRNMEHALHGVLRDASDFEKEALARKFSDRYKDDAEGFRAMLCKSEIAVEGTYAETWSFIQEGTRSLERHTNLGLLLQSS